MPPPAETAARRSNRSLLLYLSLLAFAAALFYLLRNRVPFDWRSLPQQFAAVAWSRVALALVIIYVCYWLRALRWSVLLAPLTSGSRPTAWHLLPAQLIGFTAIAIFGRGADLARPYLIARRTGTPVVTQLALYAVERAFDLAAAAILFSLALAFAPRDLPHHQLLARAGFISLAATLLLAAGAAAVRFYGAGLSRFTGRRLHPIAPKLAAAAEARVLDLQHGFGAIATLAEFLSVLALSLLMWLGIASCYLLSATAFRATPALAGFGLSATMLILAAGIGGSVVQLPILGWFTQIAVFATTLHELFNVPVEPATACAALIFTVMNLAVVPSGLLTAHRQGIALREATAASPKT